MSGSTSMLMILLLSLMVIAGFGTDLKEYGCTFNQATQRETAHGDHLVWGDQEQIVPLNLEKGDFTNFHKMIHAAMKTVLGQNLFNDTEPAFNFRQHAKKATNEIEQYKWLNDYNPRFDSRQDHLGMTMKIFKQIFEDSKKSTWSDKDVKKACYFAATSFMKEEFENVNTTNYNIEYLPNAKTITGIVGVIKVQKARELFYIVIDYNEIIDDFPLLNANKQVPEYTVRSIFLDMHIKYELIGNKKGFIKYNTPKPMTEQRFDDIVGDNSLIYLHRPLCSITYAANVITMYNLMRGRFLTVANLHGEEEKISFILTKYPEGPDWDTRHCKGENGKDTVCIGYDNCYSSNFKNKDGSFYISYGGILQKTFGVENEKILITVADQLMDPKLNKSNQRQWLINELLKTEEYMDAYKAELEMYKVNNKVELEKDKVDNEVEKKSRISGLKNIWKNSVLSCFTGSN